MSFFGLFGDDNGGVFIRQAQLLIYPIAESVDTADTVQAIVIDSSGLPDELRMVFRIEKNICSLGMPNVFEISIYNLSNATKQLLSKQATAIEFQLGYKEGLDGVVKVARGGISTVASDREEGDIKTSITCFDGLAGLAEANSSRSYVGSIALAKIVKDLANDIPGIEVSELNIKLDNTKAVGSKGRVFAGRTSSILNKLAREFGFNWSIQLGVFKVVQDNFTEGNLYQISTAAGNLINASPRLDNVNQIINGVDITTILDPRIQPGDLIELTSTVNPVLNNRYQITSISHIGDTHGDTWVSEIQCLLNDAQVIAASANTPSQVFG
jgi:hypothetical protein